MYNGILRRFVHWQSPTGIRLKIVSERFASLADEHVGAIRYSITLDEQTAIQSVNIDLRATINTAVGNYDLLHWETVDSGQCDDLLWLHSETRHSDVQLVQSMSFTTQLKDFEKTFVRSDIVPSIRLHGKLFPGNTVIAEKIVVMYTSRDTDKLLRSTLEHHKVLIQNYNSSRDTSSISSEQNVHLTYDALLIKHKQAWHTYWQCSDIIIEGDDKAQRAIRYNIYQLRISVSGYDGRYSIAARGLTGFGYRGHIFYDTEIFMLPYFIYAHPNIARNLLLYRYHLLPGAREKAEKNGCKGAQYPWECTLDGSEATPSAVIHSESGELFSVLNSILALHVTANISYAVSQYWLVTGDDEFMWDYGAEILLSTAMFWASRAELHTEHHEYEIHNVIGPDAWHEHVNNNTYTNYMARWNIEFAINTLDWLHTRRPDKAHKLRQQLGLTQELLDHWHDVAEHMRIQQDEKTGTFEQFDGFFSLAPLSQDKYRGRKTGYIALLGSSGVQVHRIINQADVLLLITLLRNQIDLKTKRVNWNYYYPITDHDFGSSLTPALHVILACELGHIKTAYDLLMKGALIDLENLNLDTADGIHLASCGAVWQGIVLGFAGLRLTDRNYITQPTWPEGWTRLAFKILYKGEPISIDLRRP